MAQPRLVILVRHAQSEHHVKRLTGGWTDSPLTDAGHEQSRRLAARFKTELSQTRVALHTSDLRRALQTAKHIGEALGVEPIADARLREFDNGEAVNMTIDEARERFPGVFDFPWRIDDRPFPGAETGRELYERVSGFLEGLGADAPVPVVVSHGAAIECMVAAWLKIPPETLEPMGFVHHATGVTTLTRDRFERPLIARLNDVSHLSGMDGWVPLDYVVPW